mmetsp:Transcript_15052/g.23291  ORF Transcript_15052/g.23291 Transcript_15052/m.23291 type:complete len:83 (-) Transcript_15052:950-1198(-)
MKSQSINKIATSEKFVKKVKEIRHFVFKSSVFCKFIRDTDNMLDKAFEADKDLSKLPKFIKDEQDLKQTFRVFRKHYPNLKN